MTEKLMHRGRFVGGWRWGSRAHLEPFSKGHRAYIDLIALTEKFAEHRGKLEAGKLYTPEGMKAELVKFVRDEGGKAVRYAREAMGVIDREIARRSQAIAPKDLIDKNDIAAAIVRQEIRTHLRTLEPSARTALLHSPDVDGVFLAAILEAPAVLSGVTAEQHDKLKTRIVERAHPEEVREIDELLQAKETVGNALTAAVAEFREQTQMPEFKLEPLFRDGAEDRAALS